MPAAMMHGGGGVLFMMTTKFASQQTNKKHMNCKTNVIKAPSPSQPYPPQINEHNIITSKNNNGNQHPAPSNKLTAEIQYFQMRKMDQR